jgi:hypothetical protein
MFRRNNVPRPIRQQIQRFRVGKNLGFVIAFSERGIMLAVAFDNPSEG